MKVDQALICDHCSLGCQHCPYGVKSGIDFFPDAKKHTSERTIYVVTGGEPMESESLPTWVEHFVERRLPFRIATAGFVPVQRWHKRLSVKHCFLGFNIGTDILTKRCSPTKEQLNTWMANWEYLRMREDTWMTITLGEGLNIETAHSFINHFKPKFVLINGEEPISNEQFNEFEGHHPKIGFMHGFNSIS